LSKEAQVFTQRLEGFQPGMRWVKGTLELGVFKGKYLSQLAYSVRDEGAPIVRIVAFLRRHNEKLIHEHRLSAEQRIREAVQSVAGTEANLSLICGFTREIDEASIRAFAPSRFSFIGIDAGHDPEDV
jgi:hypothetical protein